MRFRKRNAIGEPRSHDRLASLAPKRRELLLLLLRNEGKPVLLG